MLLPLEYITYPLPMLSVSFTASILAISVWVLKMVGQELRCVQELFRLYAKALSSFNHFLFIVPATEK